MINNCSLICQCIINFESLFSSYYDPISENQKIILKGRTRKKIHVNEIKETLHESKIIFRQIQSKLFPDHQTSQLHTTVSTDFADFPFVYSITHPIMHLGLSRIYASVFPQAIHHSLSSEATFHVPLLSTGPLRETVLAQICAIYYTNRVARPRWPLYFIIHSVIQRLVPLFLCPLLQSADNSQI